MEEDSFVMSIDSQTGSDYDNLIRGLIGKIRSSQLSFFYLFNSVVYLMISSGIYDISLIGKDFEEIPKYSLKLTAIDEDTMGISLIFPKQE